MKERRRVLRSKISAHLLLLLAIVSLYHLSPRPEAQGAADRTARAPLVSAEMMKMVKYFEGYDPTCTDVLDGHATIGHGELLHFGPCTASDNALLRTPGEASRILRRDLGGFARFVSRRVRVPINDQMHSALVSFSYNVGKRGLGDSTLLRLLNSGDYHAAAEQFDLWIHGPYGPLPGLVRRREVEKDLFLRGLSKLNISNQESA